jgi:hypothetical protein
MRDTQREWGVESKGEYGDVGFLEGQSFMPICKHTWYSDVPN